jgi:fibronectin-binding autotransporter adhesin
MKHFAKKVSNSWAARTFASGNRRTFLVLASAVAALPLNALGGGNVFWNVNGGGNWNVGGNWNPAHVPGSTDSAIVNEGAPVIGAAGADVFGITVGDSPGANATASQTAGTVTIQNFLGIGDFGGGTGSYFLEGGSLYFSAGGVGMTIGGGFTPSVDFFEQDGGTLQQNPSQKVDIANAGEYVLNNGNVFADNIQIEQGGKFQQQGGFVDTPGPLIIAPFNTMPGVAGSYIGNLGSLTVPSIYVGGSSSAAAGEGTFNVDGATVNCAGLLEVYNTAGTQLILATGGTINTGTIDFSGNPSLFAWSGGTLHLTGQPLDFTTGADPYNANPFGATLVLGSGQTLAVDTNGNSWEWLNGSGASVTQNTGSSNSCDGLYVGSTGTAATFTLNGGSLNSNGFSEFIGYIGTASVGGTGNFNQFGGTNTTSDLIVADNAPGNYVISAGSLSATTINVNSGGVFHQSGGTIAFTTFNETGGTVNLDLGLNVTSSTFNLSGGSLTTTAITNGGNFANFNWTNGSLTLTNQPVDITNGTDPSYGAILFGNSLTLNSGMSLTISNAGGWWEYLYGNASQITQNFGSSNSTPALYIGNTSGAGPAASYNMTGGTLTVGTGYIGYQGTYTGGNGLGAVTQSGGNASFGALNIGYNRQGSYMLSGTGTLAVTGAESVGLGGNLGNLTINAGTNTAGSLSVGTSGGISMHGGTLTTSATSNLHDIFQDGGTSSLGALSGTGLVSVGGGASLASMSVTQFTQGTIDIASQGLFSVQMNAHFDNTVSTLSIAGSGQLDLANNHMFIAYGGGPDPIASVAAWLKSGYAGGAWNGNGIESTVAAVTPGYALGYADGADGVVVGLPSGKIEVKYTLYGDANLDGIVNGTDFAILAAHFGQSVNGWDEGDFDFNGIVNGTDFAKLAANFGKSASGAAVVLPASEWAALDSFAAGHGLLADVPEPASLVGMVGGGLLVLRRRARV